MLRKPNRRRRLSMTSLIDVIFLLLLFFMLSSTFSKFSEVELTAGASGQSVASGPPPLFLKLGSESLRLNAQSLDLETLPETLSTMAPDDGSERGLIVSMDDSVSSQRLTDLLVALRSIKGFTPTILGGTS